MGVDEMNLQVIDGEVIMKKMFNSITLRYILTLTSSDYDVCSSHYLVYLTLFMTTRIRDRMVAVSSGIYMGFTAEVKVSTKGRKGFCFMSYGT